VKSHESDFLELALVIYQDACARCGVKVSKRDLLTFRSRVKDEGLSFLTITLPAFAKDFERSLSLGRIDSNCFRNFRKQRAIPAFLQGMLSHVFDTETGRINDDAITHSPSFSAVFVDSIRQVCLAFKKTELPCSEDRVRNAVENFVAIENSFEMFSLPKADLDEFRLVSGVLWDNIMGGLRLDMLVPRHGPGNTAERIMGNQKYVWRRWHERLEPYFPLLGFGYSPSSGELPDQSEELLNVSFIPETEEQPVRVTPVPKTLKGPRIIAIEPCCMQYTQQGLRRLIYSAIESYWMTAGHINFRDQSVNQSLAMKSSFDGQLATIDLSDASDRVPRDLALEMFRSNPDIMEAIDACRSTRAELPDGTVIGPLKKFASMGSALCFPVEAMYFYTICVIGLLRYHNLPVSFENCKSVSRDVYVYGDDIVVPVYATPTIIDYLHKYNCKVNTAKSFYTGWFRESCGVDAYYGQAVRPVYVNTPPPYNRQQVHELLSWISTGNQFERKGFWRTSQFLFRKVERLLGQLPTTYENSPVLGRTHLSESGEVRPKQSRFNRRYQRMEVRCWVAESVHHTDVIDGYAALQKSLLRLESLKGLDAQRDHSHLERSALYGAVAIKRRWVPAPYVGFRA
jgi:hypothetical protein